ncbi:AAA family ATPase [Xanthomonas albilineans]|uniref:AAA family ATPase n=1 Tax=Xanthomonas albilineans TaxID=29447 RepID=UPI0009BBCA76|nr:AAA family ATPase [Xanthomonas albilineans]
MNAIPVETPHAAARRILGHFLAEGYLPTGLHEYRDAQGNPVFWRARCKHPDGRKEIRPFRWNGTRYVPGEPPAPPEGKVLYQLPELLAANVEAIVYVAEGEACADALTALDLLATTSGSSSSAGGTDWTPLRGRRVRLWPDNDAPGRKYVVDVAERLCALGCTVEVIDIAAIVPPLPDKGDCVDWLSVNLEADAVAIGSLPLLQTTLDAACADTCHRSHVELIRGNRLIPEPVNWLWNGWLAAGKLHILGGQPGTGKTTIAMAMAATVTRGDSWPDHSPSRRGNVVIWSGEDDARDTLAPRLLAMGADMGRVYFVQGVREKGERRAFDPAIDSDVLQAELDNIGDVVLLVIDPIVSAVAGDSHKNAEVRRGLQPLVDLAQNQRCALLGITHFTKGTAGREPVERITGSLAFGALARLVMVTAITQARDGEAAKRFLARAKSNIGPDGGGYVYDLQQLELHDFQGVIASSVRWGAALEGTARELLDDAERQDDGQGQDAVGFLRELLRDGMQSAKDVYREAGEAGFSVDAMKRAKRKIGAVAVKRGGHFGGSRQEWTWQLPADNCTEGSEGSAQNNAPPSTPSGDEALPSWNQ